MRFEKRQSLRGTVEQVEQAMLDPRYLDYLLQNHGVLLEVQALERSEEGPLVRRRVRYRPRPVIPSVGPKQVPPEWFAFVEQSTYDRRKKEMTFSNVPSSGAISRLLINTGTLRLRPSGSGTERTVEGEIKLQLPFLLKPLAMIGERLIHVEGLKILDAEAVVLNRYLTEASKA